MGVLTVALSWSRRIKPLVKAAFRRSAMYHIRDCRQIRCHVQMHTAQQPIPRGFIQLVQDPVRVLPVNRVAGFRSAFDGLVTGLVDVVEVLAGKSERFKKTSVGRIVHKQGPLQRKLALNYRGSR